VGVLLIDIKQEENDTDSDRFQLSKARVETRQPTRTKKSPAITRKTRQEIDPAGQLSIGDDQSKGTAAKRPSNAVCLSRSTYYGSTSKQQ
jgi:hypothetical protein